MKFDSCHPAINFIFFVAAIAMTIAFNHPVFLAISYISAFAYSVKLNGKRAVIFNLCLVVFIAVWTWLFSTFNHFGVTDIGKTVAGNHMTLEALVYGFVVGVIVATVIMWFSCVFAVISSDKVIYLFRRVSPKLSLFISMLLRMIPRIKTQYRKIDAAQQCIGRGSGQGGIARRLRQWASRVSITVTWLNDSQIETSDSMRSRGYTLKGRTAFSIYRFDNRDRSLVIFMFLCLSLMLMAILLDQTYIIYSPQIILNHITAVSVIFYIAYAAFCNLPLAMEVWASVRFGK
ncbi:MAG: energy-coupling factor transporter transmembrane component T [Coriobacteriales bacterium]